MKNGNNGQQTFLPTTESECEPSDASTKVTGRRLMALLERQQFKCALSGVKLTPKTASLDHCVPVSKGGGIDMDNVQIVHEVINRMKGTLDNEQFREWCDRVAGAEQ